MKHHATHGVDTKYFSNIIFSIIFFTITPLVIFISIFSIYFLNKPKTDIKVLAYETNSKVRIYSYFQNNPPAISSSVESTDARVSILRKYLKYYSSPLEPYAKMIVSEADFNQLDYRLLTAIAQQESNLCKKIPDNSYNCWGWGIHSKGSLGFNSYADGIKTVSRGINKNYIQKGLYTPTEIMSKYTPQSSGSWADGITGFMEAIEHISY